MFAKLTLPMLVLCAVAFGGCVTIPVQFKVGDQVFNTKDEALAQQKTLHAAYLADIMPLNKPVAGNALLVCASKELLYNKDIKYTSGNRSLVSQVQKDWLVEHSMIDNEFLVSAMKKRGVFNNVDFQRSATPEETDIGQYDCLIYNRYIAEGVSQWYVRTKHDPIPKPWDWGLTASDIGSVRIIKFCDSIVPYIMGDSRNQDRR